MRVAFVHDWLVTYAGADRLLEEMLNVFPDADIFSLVDFLAPGERHFIRNKPVVTSFIQKLPFARKHFRAYLPLFPLAIQQLDLSGYDLVVSNSFCVAKGVITDPSQLHICMCCSPVRYAWDLQEEYLKERGLAKGPKAWFVRWVLHGLRQWDAASANLVDQYVAISHFIGGRIRKFYGRTSMVIYPPVDVHRFQLREDKEDFYFAASRQVPYKKIHLIVEAFARMPKRKLVVIGDGPEAEKIAHVAQGHANITLLGYQASPVLRDHMQRAKAFLFAAKEDFGIVVLEAQAAGTPVIAFNQGGACETVRGLGVSAQPTGVFFDEQTPEAIMAAVDRFEAAEGQITPQACRNNAMLFAPERFRDEFRDLVEEQLLAHRRSLSFPDLLGDGGVLAPAPRARAPADVV